MGKDAHISFAVSSILRLFHSSLVLFLTLFSSRSSSPSSTLAFRDESIVVGLGFDRSTFIDEALCLGVCREVRSQQIRWYA